MFRPYLFSFYEYSQLLSPNFRRHTSPLLLFTSRPSWLLTLALGISDKGHTQVTHAMFGANSLDGAILHTILPVVSLFKPYISNPTDRLHHLEQFVR
jgi:hypothetical protein